MPCYALLGLNQDSDELRCHNAEDRNFSLQLLNSCWTIILPLQHRSGWCRICGANWLISNYIEQSISFISDAETKLLGCHVFKFISLSQLHHKIRDLICLQMQWFWNLKLLYKDYLHAHLTGFSISIHDKKIALHVVLFY